MLKRFLRSLLRLFYGFRSFNEEALRTPGPVLLVPNHVSWLDWLFLGVCLEEDWKFVTSSATAQTTWIHRKIMINRYTFPIDMSSPYAVRHMAEFLQGGGRLVLFAEGRLTLTGVLMKLFDGTGFLLHRTNAKIMTAYIRGGERLPFVRHPGWTKWFPRVTVHFSPVLRHPPFAHATTAFARTHLTKWLRDRMVEQQFDVEMEHGPKTLLEAICEQARLRPRHVVLEELSRAQLTYRRLLLGADLLSQVWQKKLGSAERVGVLLPNVNAMVAVILSVWASGKVPAILNFSTGPSVMLACAELAGLKQIITSKAFLERAHLNLDPLLKKGIELVFLEEARPLIGRMAKLTGLVRRFFRPGAMPPFAQRDRAFVVGDRNVAAPIGDRNVATPIGDRNVAAPLRHSCRPEQETAVILFTSGSEGAPKGVELTHRNILANIRQILATVDLQDHDRIFNALPLFHSFGLSIGTFLGLVRGLFVFLYPSPLHFRVIPTAIYDRACTVMIGTNTFLQGYARKAHPYDLRSVRYLFAGAEKLQETTANTYARVFGTRILEGYGATECSPCVSVASPLEPLFGAAGRLLPRMEGRIEPVEGITEGGRLLVKGPNVMKGYLNPDANAKFQALQGWYDTGDIAKIDDEGHVHILGRLKRFAKISGEMVSLTAVEEALAGAFPEFGPKIEVAVLNRPDPDKGEVLVAVTNDKRLQVEHIRAAIKAKGLSNLAAPREVICVPEIPKLGTGKVNHRQLAEEIINRKL